MGSAASTLSPEQSGSLTRALKSKYELLQKEGLSDEDIRLKLSDEYNQLVAEMKRETEKNEKAEKVEKAEKEKTEKIEKAPPDSQSNPLAKFNPKGKNAKAATRRRSFDSSNKSATTKEPAAAAVALPNRSPSLTQLTDTAAQPALMVSESVPVIAAAPSTGAPPVAEVVDSWDSVTQLPFCTVCQMGFKSEAFLERHLKFSDMHVKNLMKQDTEGKIDVPKNEVQAQHIEIAPMPEVTRKQVEGEDFKMLYAGSKLFWRTQDNIDLHFYHHVLPHCIEIIPFDSRKNKEFSRIYLDYKTLYDNLLKSNEEFEEGEEETRRTMLTTHILQHLQLHSVTGETIVTYVKLSGDENYKSPVLSKAPVVVVPVVVTRRRRTNAEEIEATMVGLTKDREALAQATDKANKIATLVYSCVKLFSQKKWYSQLNPVRQRWIKAIRRVIRKKLVAATRKMLSDKAAAKEQAAKMQKRNNLIGKAKEIH